MHSTSIALATDLSQSGRTSSYSNQVDVFARTPDGALTPGRAKVSDKVGFPRSLAHVSSRSPLRALPAHGLAGVTEFLLALAAQTADEAVAEPLPGAPAEVA